MSKLSKCFCGFAVLCMIIAMTPCLSIGADSNDEYTVWNTLGLRVAYIALEKTGYSTGIDTIVLTNAGYAEINGSSTEGCLDGLQDLTHASRGNNTLMEVHSHYDKPLWFAIYYPSTGMCVYLQVNPAAVPKLFLNAHSRNYSQILTDNIAVETSELFSIVSAMNINPAIMYANAEEYGDKLDNQLVFGENAFRVVTLANAIAQGAPKSFLRALEFHDHYCMGVTSGIFAVNYIKKYFPLTSGGSYFVQSVQPWCKEDALMTLLNATPGKGGYSALYSTAEDRALWKEEAQNAATIIYRQDGSTKKWDGIVISFTWGEPECPDYGNSTITHLCKDLWYLDLLDQPESFITVIKTFELPDGVVPKDWARPGVDPMEKLGLIQE